MALTITEEWIRERVQLKHNNLEDVRSLSLPGTYHEKIAGLGSSLRSFFRLKHLDLSRNAVDTLQGLESLKLLEKLNLYYNNVSNLRELYRLRHNQQLQEVDLRLNPVARNEPDYRLFLIHMLPNLRRLDDRAVRDTERKAALMHFSSEQATQLTLQKQTNMPPEEKKPNPRAEHVKTLGKPGVLEDDDVAILDMIAHAHLAKDPRPLTGSKAKTPAVEEYSEDSVREMDYHAIGLGDEPVTKVISAETHHAPVPALPYSETYPMSIGGHARSGPEKHQHHQPPPGVDLDSLQAKYPHIPVIPAISTTPPTPEGEDPPPTLPPMATKDSTAKRNRVQFADDPNLKFQDEIEAYTSYKATGHFTPCPGTGNESQDIQVENSAKTQQTKPAIDAPRDRDWNRPYHSVELYREPMSQSENEEASTITQESSGYLLSQHTMTDSQSNFSTSNNHQLAAGPKLNGTNPPEGTTGDTICKISDLVDKYWNGARSLIANQRFTSQMNQLLRQQSAVGTTSISPSISSMVEPNDPDAQKQIQHLRNEIAKLRDENASLRSKFVSLPPDLEQADESKLKTSLLRAQRDLSILRSRFQSSLADNRRLQDQLADLESKSSTTRPNDLADLKQITNLNQENSRLKDELRRVSEDLKRSSQMQEMATLLQQSHTSLLKTNEHLMREMEGLRRGRQDIPRSYTPDTMDSMPVYLPEPSRPTSYSSESSRYTQNFNQYRPSAMNGCS